MEVQEAPAAAGVKNPEVVFLYNPTTVDETQIDEISSAVQVQLDPLSVMVKTDQLDNIPEEASTSFTATMAMARRIVTETGALAVFWCNFKTETVSIHFSGATEQMHRHVPGMNVETIAVVLQGAVQALLAGKELPVSMSSPSESPAANDDDHPQPNQATTEPSEPTVSSAKPQSDAGGTKSSASARTPKKEPAPIPPDQTPTYNFEDDTTIVRAKPFDSKMGILFLNAAYVISAIQAFKQNTNGLSLGLGLRLYAPFYLHVSYTLEQWSTQPGNVRLYSTTNEQFILARLRHQHMELSALYRRSIRRLDFGVRLGIDFIYGNHKIHTRSELIDTRDVGSQWQLALVPAVQMGFRPFERIAVIVAVGARILIVRAAYIVDTPYGNAIALTPWAVQPLAQIGVSFDF